MVTQHLFIAIASTATMITAILPSAGVKAQSQTSSCSPGDQECLIQQYQEETQYNQDRNFRTPNQINQYFQDRVGNVCSQDNSANCTNLDSQRELLQNNERSIQLRELQQQDLENIFSQ